MLLQLGCSRHGWSREASRACVLRGSARVEPRIVLREKGTGSDKVETEITVIPFDLALRRIRKFRGAIDPVIHRPGPMMGGTMTDASPICWRCNQTNAERDFYKAHLERFVAACEKHFSHNALEEALAVYRRAQEERK